jgi:hypothetical protein
LVSRSNSNPDNPSFLRIDGFLVDRKCADTVPLSRQFLCCFLSFLQTNSEEYPNQSSTSWASEIDYEDAEVCIHYSFLMDTFNSTFIRFSQR